MYVHMKVEFEDDEVRALLAAEYVRIFGPVKPGYELHVRHEYIKWIVEMIKKEEEEDTTKAVTNEDPDMSLAEDKPTSEQAVF